VSAPACLPHRESGTLGRMRLPAWLPAAALCAACTTVSSSAYVPAPTGATPAAPSAGPPVAAAAVAVRFTRDPAGAEELGVVEAHGAVGYGSGRDVSRGKTVSSPRSGASLQAIVDELKKRVASVGGDVARVDAIATRYEMVRESYTYDCGTTTTTSEPRTVTRTGPDGRMTTQTEMQTVTKHDPRTCTGWRDVEAGVLTLTGRAFRSKGAQP
jgi:hypothetical protein